MTANIVKKILRDHPETRSSDKHLMIKVWEHFGLILTEAQRDKFYHAPSTESVRRVRQKIQEQGFYPAKDNIRKYRKHKSYEVQQNAPIASPERIEQILEPKAVHVQLEF